MPTLVGHLHLLWHWCLDYAEDGDLAAYAWEDLADAAMWDGDPDLFVGALLQCGPGDSDGFLEADPDGNLRLHDWNDYAGRLIEQREKNRERQRRHRDKQGTNDTPNGDVTVTSRVTSASKDSDETPPRARETVTNQPEPTNHDQPEVSADALVEQPFELFEVLCEELQVDVSTVAPAFKGKQLGIAKKLITEGHTVDQVRRCIRYLRSDPFWVSSGIDLGTVLSQIGKWEVNGELAAVLPRGSPNGRAPRNPYQAIDDFNVMMDELEASAETRDIQPADAAPGRDVPTTATRGRRRA